MLLYFEEDSIHFFTISIPTTRCRHRCEEKRLVLALMPVLCVHSRRPLHFWNGETFVKT